MMCCLPTVGARSRRVLFFRTGRVDFSDRDRMLLTLLRPHLAECYARGENAAPTELTARQRQLMRLVAEGKTNAEIAAELVLSPYTVRKHLENIFARLGVTTRAAAVARLDTLT
jgi:DNA-binding NarL/FixJ family response regulator